MFIQRLWRTLKYECVYIHAFETGKTELRAGARKLDQLLQCRLTARGPWRGDPR